MMNSARVTRIIRPIVAPSRAGRSFARRYATLPLTEQLPSVPSQSDAPQSRPVLQESKLPNGVRVVTVGSQVPVAAVGVFVEAGSRYEDLQTSGSFFALKSLAFTGTYNRTALRLAREFEVLGATYTAASGREQMVYSSETQSDKVNEVVPILADVLRPRIAEWEIRDQLPIIADESRAVQSNARTFVFEQLHAEAYRNRGLGQPNYVPESNVHHLDGGQLKELVARFYTPDRVVVVGTGGVEHQAFSELVSKAFEGASLQRPAAAAAGDSPVKPPAEYSGGDFRLAGNFETNLAIAFQGLAWNDKDLHALHVLQALLGGAHRSLTATHPGRGFTSRLGSKVTGPIQELSTFVAPYSDSGLFGVFGRAEPGHAAQLADVITRELVSAASKSAAGGDLSRAVAQAKAAVLFGTERRSALLDFVGTQAVARRSVQAPEQFAKALESVSADDVQRVARRLLQSRPTVVAVGDVVGVPSSDALQRSLKA